MKQAYMDVCVCVSVCANAHKTRGKCSNWLHPHRYCVCHSLITHQNHLRFKKQMIQFRLQRISCALLISPNIIQYNGNNCYTRCWRVYFLFLSHISHVLVYFHVIPAFQQRFNKKTKIDTIQTALHEHCVMVCYNFHCEYMNWVWVWFSVALKWSSLFVN